MTRSSRTSVGTGEGCGSGLLGCIIGIVALAFTVVVLLAMVPAVRDLAWRGVGRLTGMGVVTVTIPEGWNRFQIASRLANRGIVTRADVFIETTEDPALLARMGIPAESAEGYLFPDTYEFYSGTDPELVVRRLVENQREKFEEIADRHPEGLRDLERLGGDPEHLAVVLASIVEKEAARKEEQGIIAGVFLNRLLLEAFSSRLLQADPTVAYGCVAARPTPATCKGFSGALERRHLEDATNPYNTYVHPGLPPGPISNPGISAIEAVLHPTITSYLYFVARGDGSHEFSATLEEHKAAVKKYRHGG